MVGRGGNSRNWLSPLFMLIHYSMAKYDNIPGHPGYYISRNGKLYTRHIPGNTKGGLYKDKGVLRNRYSLSNGRYVKYYRVEIQGKKWYVHRLVAFVWLPNPEKDIAKSLGISRHIVQESIQLKFKELWQGRK